MVWLSTLYYIMYHINIRILAPSVVKVYKKKYIEMELNIGSNIIHNTSGVIRVLGKKQIYLESEERDRQLLLTMDIYNSKGNHIAKLSRNTWEFNDDNRFEVKISLPSIKLIDKTSGDILIEVNVVDKGTIQILQGKFYTHEGSLIEITPQFLRIENITMRDNTIDGYGSIVAIG